MIEIKDTRKTATKDPRPKRGDLVRINKDYYLCVAVGTKELALYSVTDGLVWEEPREFNKENEYAFHRNDVSSFDIEVITNKITLTIE